jgi:ribosome maturation factor RimP
VGESPLFYWDFGMNRGQLQEYLENVAESVTRAAGLELVELEVKGSGRNQLIRVTIDKPEGVTHADCEAVSREMSVRLDAEDPIENSYDLEVSSPGIERKLTKWQDWERFQGRKAKVVLKQPVGDLKHFDGIISRAASDDSGTCEVTVSLAGGREVTFPLDQVDKANLKFDW